MIEVVVAVVAVVLALVGGVVGWVRVDQHGAERERRRQAEEGKADAEAREERARTAPASPREAAGVLDRLRRRRERLRHEAGRLE